MAGGAATAMSLAEGATGTTALPEAVFVMRLLVEAGFVMRPRAEADSVPQVQNTVIVDRLTTNQKENNTDPVLLAGGRFANNANGRRVHTRTGVQRGLV